MAENRRQIMTKPCSDIISLSLRSRNTSSAVGFMSLIKWSLRRNSGSSDLGPMYPSIIAVLCLISWHLQQIWFPLTPHPSFRLLLPLVHPHCVPSLTHCPWAIQALPWGSPPSLSCICTWPGTSLARTWWVFPLLLSLPLICCPLLPSGGTVVHPCHLSLIRTPSRTYFLGPKVGQNHLQGLLKCRLPGLAPSFCFSPSGGVVRAFASLTRSEVMLMLLGGGHTVNTTSPDSAVNWMGLHRVNI